MSKILVLGFTLPRFIPGENKAVPRAFNLRTAQLVEALLDGGNEVLLCARLHHDEITASGGQPAIAGLACRVSGPDMASYVRDVRQAHSVFRPDAILCVGQMAALVLEKFRRNEPVWIDLFGDPLTDLQMELCARGSNRGLATHIWIDRLNLTRGDVFSTCSEPQRYALIGRLAGLRRLEKRTCTYNLVHTIWPAMSPQLGRRHQNGFGLPRYRETPFQLIWYGGFNAWVDEKHLFGILDRVMQQNRGIRFLSIGEGLADPSRYERFVAQISNSSFADRCKILGWQPYAEIRARCAGAQLGLSILRNLYETQLGVPTRLVEMMDLGLPIFSIGTDLSAKVESWGAGLSAGYGQVDVAAEKILALSKDPVQWQKMSNAGKAVTARELSVRSTCASLADWAESPEAAPDRTDSLTDWLQDRMHLALERVLWTFGGNFW